MDRLAATGTRIDTGWVGRHVDPGWLKGYPLDQAYCGLIYSKERVVPAVLYERL